MKKEIFKNLIKSIILEVKKESTESTDTEPSKDYTKKDNTYTKNVDAEYAQTANKVETALSSITKKIDKNIKVQMGPNGDVWVTLAKVFSVRIKPRWTNTYDIEAFRNESDRVIAIALSYDQVVNFIKVNFGAKTKSYVQASYDKSIGNLEDKSKKPSKDLPKSEPVKVKEVPKKDIEQPSKKKEDQPDAPMTPVKEKDIEKQVDHKSEKPKMKKTKDEDDSHQVSWKK